MLGNSKRIHAVSAGAIEVSGIEMIRRCRHMRKVFTVIDALDVTSVSIIGEGMRIEGIVTDSHEEEM